MAEIHKRNIIKKRKSEWHLKEEPHKLEASSDRGITAPKTPGKAELALKEVSGNILRGFKIMGGAVVSSLKKTGEYVTSEEGQARLAQIGENANKTFREPLNKEFSVKPKGL